MAFRTLPEILADMELFSGVPAEVISDLIDAGATIHTPAGRTVVTQGSADSGLQVVLKGNAHVEVNGVRRSDVGPGDYFGEISLIDGGPRSATLVAGEGGLDTFAIAPLKFSPLIDRHPILARALLRCLCARIRNLEAVDATDDA